MKADKETVRNALVFSNKILMVLTITLTPVFAYSEEGLFHAKDTKVPGAIEIAGESVLQIVLLGNNPQKISQTAYDSYLSVNPRDDFMLFLAQQRVKKCKERSQEICEVPYSSYGTAFVTDNGTALWTAKHVIEAQMNSKLLFELYNSDGEKVYDTSDSNDQASLALTGKRDMIQKRHPNFVLSDSILNFTSDYAKINLTHTLAIRSLRISNKRPKLNERVYTIGYANISDRSLSSTVKTRSRVAIGAVSPYEEATPQETTEQKQQRTSMEDFIVQHLIVMDLDGIHGQSGSPVLNESGEVVGIYIAGNQGIRGNDALRGIPPHFEGIELNGK